MSYDLLRALHIIAVIAWVAGLMMLPRLFVYHFSAAPGDDWDDRLKKAEGRLMRIIMDPALLLALIFGSVLIWQGLTLGRYPWPFDLWLWGKLGAVIALIGVHHMLAVSVKKFARGDRPKTERYWRMMNEVPFVLVIIIVLLAVLEPR